MCSIKAIACCRLAGHLAANRGWLQMYCWCRQHCSGVQADFVRRVDMYRSLPMKLLHRTFPASRWSTRACTTRRLMSRTFRSWCTGGGSTGQRRPSSCGRTRRRSTLTRCVEFASVTPADVASAFTPWFAQRHTACIECRWRSSVSSVMPLKTASQTGIVTGHTHH